MRTLHEKKEIPIPEGCKVTLKDKLFTFEGPLGKQDYDASKFRFTFEIVDNEIIVHSWHGNKTKTDLLGTVAAHIKNSANGVVTGFKYVLRSGYKHFSINLSIVDNGKTVVVKNFLGSKIPRIFKVRGSSTALAGDTKDTLIIQGININDVSQTAAHISNDCAKRKNNDIRIFMDGIFIAEKTSIIIQ